MSCSMVLSCRRQICSTPMLPCPLQHRSWGAVSLRKRSLVRLRPHRSFHIVWMQHQKLLKGLSLVEGACLVLPVESESQKVFWLDKELEGPRQTALFIPLLQHKGLLSKKVRLATSGDAASEKRQDGVESTGSTTCFKDSTRRKHFDAPRLLTCPSCSDPALKKVERLRDSVKVPWTL